MAFGKLPGTGKMKTNAFPKGAGKCTPKGGKMQGMVNTPAQPAGLPPGEKQGAKGNPVMNKKKC